jgi:hypothetical protein
MISIKRYRMRRICYLMRTERVLMRKERSLMRIAHRLIRKVRKAVENGHYQIRLPGRDPLDARSSAQTEMLRLWNSSPLLLEVPCSAFCFNPALEASTCFVQTALLRARRSPKIGSTASTSDSCRPGQVGDRFRAWCAFRKDRKRKGAYSRRINIQHRLVYQVYEAEQTTKVLRM